MIEVRGARPDQMQEIAAFIAALQVDPRHHIGYLDDRAESIAAGILEHVGEGWPNATFLAYEDGELVGCIFYDAPANHHRVWINGPFSTKTDPVAWQAIADALYAYAPQPVPEKLMEHELFSDTANENIDQFATRHMFLKLIPAAALIMPRDVWMRGKAYAPVTNSIQLLEPAYHDQLRQLHPQTFPNTYATADELIAHHNNGENMVFIQAEGKQLCGYIAVQIDESSECYIDYLGVAPEFRRTGIGRKLITKGLQWGFSHPAVPLAHLTVNRENDAAIGLYVSLGFTHERTLVGYRKRFG